MYFNQKQGKYKYELINCFYFLETSMFVVICIISGMTFNYFVMRDLKFLLVKEPNHNRSDSEGTENSKPDFSLEDLEKLEERARHHGLAVND